MTTPHECFADQRKKPGELYKMPPSIKYHQFVPACRILYLWTWLNIKLTDSELLLDDYLIFRSDRESTEDKNPHGVILIANQVPSNDLNCWGLRLDKVDNCVICEVQVNKNKRFFCSFYNPANTSTYR